MKQQIVIAIVFFMAAILMMITSIVASVNDQPINWLLLTGDCCFLVGGIVWLIQGGRSGKKMMINFSFWKSLFK